MRTFVCVQCPLSCQLSVSGSDEELVVEGNRCPRGREYAIQERTCPTRSLTTTVRTIFPDFPRLPVRTAGEVPLQSVHSVMEVINSLQVEKRLRPGDMVLAKIPGTDVPLIATDDMFSGGNEYERAAPGH
ncbi:MAG: DUF1667 domain-containing protein [Firmicutes bacterium]|nr:DUF1667 domain-containing protein [Bacillota bacterium]